MDASEKYNDDLYEPYYLLNSFSSGLPRILYIRILLAFGALSFVYDQVLSVLFFIIIGLTMIDWIEHIIFSLFSRQIWAIGTPRPRFGGRSVDAAEILYRPPMTSSELVEVAYLESRRQRLPGWRKFAHQPSRP